VQLLGKVEERVRNRRPDTTLTRLPRVHIAFESSPRASVGVEWELQLVDRETRQLRQDASAVLADIAPDGDHPKAKHELFESTIEVITGVCQTVAEARADLEGTIGEVSKAADRRGLGLMCAGTHPTALWTDQRVSPDSRYYRLIHETQWLARRLLIFGVHVHVGVRSPEKAVRIVDALAAYVPHILALSASSPYWEGTDTGLASVRTKVFEGLPIAGLPQQLGSWAAFESFMDTMTRSMAVETIRDVWWDIRPHPNFGTVELRIADGLPSADEVATHAALGQCLVERFDQQLDAGYELPVPAPWVLQENKWRAARYGLDAELIGDRRGGLVPVRTALLELADDLAPTARRLDCAAELAGVERIVSGGASYQRQRAVAKESAGDLGKVVDSLLAEMRTGLPA
jgi:carboxylate-amine ligase